jgi:hypothetical protein
MKTQQTSPETELVELDQSFHHCPGCLWFKLSEAPTPDQKIGLTLTISFGAQTENILGGSVAFGLRRGEFCLNLEKGKLPYQKSLHETFQKEVEEQVTTSSSKSGKQKFEVSVGGAEPKVNPGWENSSSQGFGRSIAQKRQQFYRKGGDRDPIWVFELIAPDAFLADANSLHYLTGALVNEPLGNLEIETNSFRLKAQFTIEIRDVFLEGVSGIWAEDIGRNHLAILQRAMVRFLLRTKLKSPISFAEFQYGVGKVSIQPIPGSSEWNLSDADASNWERELQLLKTTIQQVEESDKNASFSHLVDIAQLDLSKDFAGANLSEIDLSQVDFHGADLRDSNFKNTQLKNANLSGANLRGADLRGTDLSHATLQRADLRSVLWDKAILRSADLAEAKFSSRALVKAEALGDARFSPDSRISRSMKEVLLSRGALLEMKASEEIVKTIQERQFQETLVRQRNTYTQNISDVLSKIGQADSKIKEIVNGRERYTSVDGVILKHRKRDL